MTRSLISALMLSSFAVLASSCSLIPTSETIDMTEAFAGTPEIDRLRWFKEINAGPILKSSGLTGKGVRVTIMGESVDAAHPDLAKNMVRQYNAYSQKGRMVTGTGKQPLGADKFQLDDGHGTHIAGTIAAACDGVGIQGLACNATLDAYDLGAYDDPDRVPIEGWGDADEFERFLDSFAYALKDVTQQGQSRITTGSFNLESPAIRYTGGSLQGKTITDIIATAEKNFDSVDDLISGGYAVLADPLDKAYLESAVEKNGDDPFVALGSVLPLSSNWVNLENAIAAYQANDGVYLITESNNDFSDRTSALNAMPSLSDKVDPALWLSVVMVVPTDIEGLTSSSDEETFNARLAASDYEAPLNTCGSMARDYCILTPSWNVLSTMTERVAFRGEDLNIIDGRYYQTLEGHSMGAPMVAAALALMEEENLRKGYGYSMKDLVRIMKSSANRTFKSYDSNKHGVGILDVNAALSAMEK